MYSFVEVLIRICHKSNWIFILQWSTFKILYDGQVLLCTFNAYLLYWRNKIYTVLTSGRVIQVISRCEYDFEFAVVFEFEDGPA
jgi:hypothetical protein